MISKPLVSIVILTYNNLEYTQQCLDSIFAKTQVSEFETIIVDNASSDGTPEFLNEFVGTHPNARMILNSTNEGFARGNNIGAATATGEYLVFLNNDTVVTRGWLSRLIHHLKDPTVGMVGPVTNSSGNETRIRVDYDGLGEMDAFAEEYTLAHKRQAFEIRMLPFMCVALRRKVFEEIGPLDERFGVGMFEDDDYALRLKEKGYKLLCAEDVFIHHWGSAGFSTLKLIDYWLLFKNNLDQFEEKWGVPWQPHLYRPELMSAQIRQNIEDALWHAIQIDERDQSIKNLQEMLASKEQELEAIHAYMSELYDSRAWKLIQFLWKLRLSLAPEGSWRLRIYQRSLRFLSTTLGMFASGLNWFKNKLAPPKISWSAYSFNRFKSTRDRRYKSRLDWLYCPSIANKVSIVLPVYNGAEYLAESIESILRQTYPDFELIVVDDGSTDETPEILERYARQDHRLHIIYQQNQRLPRALTNGFQSAQGEYLTWTSADNRLKSHFLEKMVKCLSQHPEWDMIYANKDIIGEDGKPLLNSTWYSGYQSPPGSEHIMLPDDPSELNVWANNYIGGAFMYRDRVYYLLGDYSSRRFGTEDYDYWMRVNALLNLRHTDFDEPIYEYRFHENSLTSKDEELGITRNRIRLMIFDDFRRNFYLGPLAWIIEVSGETKTQALAKQIRDWTTDVNHILIDQASINLEQIPTLWFPVIYIKLVDDIDESCLPPTDLPPGIRKVLVLNSPSILPDEMDEVWDACITTLEQRNLPRLKSPKQGWLSIPQVETLCTALDIQTRGSHLAMLEAEIEDPPQPTQKITVVICTYKRGDMLLNAMKSVAEQSFPPEDYELIIVNNDPNDDSVAKMVEKIRFQYFKNRSYKLKLIQCPFTGLSFARNAGISEASGQIVSFLDDDAIARSDWLEQVWSAFEKYPQSGVVGGSITLEIPQPRPRWLKPRWEKFWSQFKPNYSQPTRVDKWWEFPWGANWSAKRNALLEIGGFRINYGRKGSDFGGGEELVASGLIQRLGYEIVVNPAAEVFHIPDPSRYTFQHVWRTIFASKITEYNLQIDFHLPIMKLGVMSLLYSSFRYLMTAVIKRDIYIHQRLEYLIYTLAELELVDMLVKDLFARNQCSYIVKKP